MARLPLFIRAPSARMLLTCVALTHVALGGCVLRPPATGCRKSSDCAREFTCNTLTSTCESIHPPCAVDVDPDGTVRALSGGSVSLSGGSAEVVVLHRQVSGPSSPACISRATVSVSAAEGGCKLSLGFQRTDEGTLTVRSAELETGTGCLGLEPMAQYRLRAGQAALIQRSGSPDSSSARSCFDGLFAVTGTVALTGPSASTDVVLDLTVRGAFESTGSTLFSCPASSTQGATDGGIAISTDATAVPPDGGAGQRDGAPVTPTDGGGTVPQDAAGGCTGVCGDVDQNGTSDMADYMALDAIVQGRQAADTCAQAQGDLLKDARLSPADLLVMTRWLASRGGTFRGMCMPCAYACGDVNADGAVDQSDYGALSAVIQRQDLRNDLNDACMVWRADVNGDGKYDADDLIGILDGALSCAR